MRDLFDSGREYPCSPSSVGNLDWLEGSSPTNNALRKIASSAVNRVAGIYRETAEDSNKAVSASLFLSVGQPDRSMAHFSI